MRARQLGRCWCETQPVESDNAHRSGLIGRALPASARRSGFMPDDDDDDDDDSELCKDTAGVKRGSTLAPARATRGRRAVKGRAGCRGSRIPTRSGGERSRLGADLHSSSRMMDLDGRGGSRRPRLHLAGLLLLSVLAGVELGLALSRGGPRGLDLPPDERTNNNDRLKYALNFQATGTSRTSNNIYNKKPDGKVTGLAEAGSESGTTIIMLADAAAANLHQLRRRAAHVGSGGSRSGGSKTMSPRASANPSDARGAVAARPTDDFRRTIDLPSRSAPIEMTRSAAIRMKSNSIESPSGSDDDANYDNNNDDDVDVDDDGGNGDGDSGSQCDSGGRPAAAATRRQAYPTTSSGTKMKTTQTNEICTPLVCCTRNRIGQTGGDEPEQSAGRGSPRRLDWHVPRGEAAAPLGRCPNAEALEIRAAPCAGSSTRWRSRRLAQLPRQPHEPDAAARRERLGRGQGRGRRRARGRPLTGLTQKQKLRPATRRRRRRPEYPIARCCRRLCAKLARRRAKISPASSTASSLRNSSARPDARNQTTGTGGCHERRRRHSRTALRSEHSTAIVFGQSPDNNERAPREATRERPVAARQQQQQQQQQHQQPQRTQDFKRPPLKAFSIQEDEQVQEQLVELLAEFYAHLRSTQRKFAIAARRLMEQHGSTQQANHNLTALRIQMGADEANLTRWLEAAKHSNKHNLIEGLEFELITERPNRTINVCADGPKVLVLPNVSDIIYCLTHDQWIEKLWADSLRLSAFHYPIILLNILIFLAGTTGNIFVCLSVKRNHQLRSVTNYFIVNLAFADFLVILICLPATVVWDLSLTWFFDTIPCKLIMFLQDVSISVSVLTLTAISIDRYYAICHPLKFKTSLNQAKHMIVLIWLVSLVIMAPDLMYLSAKQSADLSEAGIDTVLYSDCNYNWSEDASRAFQFVKTVLLYLLPFILMFCAHYKILKVLQLASSIMSADGDELNQTVVTASSVAATGPLLSAAATGVGADETGMGKQNGQVRSGPSAPREPLVVTTSTASGLTAVVTRAEPTPSTKDTHDELAPAACSRCQRHCNCHQHPNHRHQHLSHRKHSHRHHHHDHHHHHHHHQQYRCHRRARHECKHQHRLHRHGSNHNSNNINNSLGLTRRSDLKLVRDSLKQSDQAHQRQHNSRRRRDHVEQHATQAQAPKSSASSSSSSSASSASEVPSLGSAGSEPESRGAAQRPAPEVSTERTLAQSSARQVRFSDQRRVGTADDEVAATLSPAASRSQTRQPPLATLSAAFRLPAILNSARKGATKARAHREKRSSKGYLKREKIIRGLLLERESSFDNQLKVCLPPPAKIEQPDDATAATVVETEKQLAQTVSATDGQDLKRATRPVAEPGAKSPTMRNHLRPLESVSSPLVAPSPTNATATCAPAIQPDASRRTPRVRPAARRLARSRSVSVGHGLAQARQNPCGGPNDAAAGACVQQQSHPGQVLAAPPPPPQPSSAFMLTMHNKSKLESRRKAAKMLTAIVVLFGICYLPVHLINFLRQFIDDIPQTDVTSTISMLSHCVCYLNSAINPIIYNHMNSVFRAEFRKFLSCLDWMHQRPQQKQPGAQIKQQQQQNQITR